MFDVTNNKKKVYSSKGLVHLVLFSIFLCVRRCMITLIIFVEQNKANKQQKKQTKAVLLDYTRKQSVTLCVCVWMCKSLYDESVQLFYLLYI